MFLPTFVQNLVKYLQLATTHPSKEKHLYQDNVRTEQLCLEGTIWYAANHGDRINLDRFIDRFDEECLKQRDQMGATPLHILCLRSKCVYVATITEFVIGKSRRPKYYVILGLYGLELDEERTGMLDRFLSS